MNLSNRGREFVKTNEGLKLKAYKDNGDIWTIGYGHTGVDVKPGMVIDEEEALLILESDLTKAVLKVNKLVKVPLSQSQFDALVDFVFNIGGAAFSHSTLLRKLNAGDYLGAAEQFDRWVYDNKKVVVGLVNRRERERVMFEAETPPHAKENVTISMSEGDGQMPPNTAITIHWLTKMIDRVLNFFRSGK